MDQFRAVSGIDFDGVGDEPGVRVEPGETLPAIPEDTAAWLLQVGAIEAVPADEVPAEKPKRRTRKAAE